MANPAPNPNAEIDAAVKSSVDKFQHGKGADAIVDINKIYDKHSNDAVFRAQFTGELTKGLKDQGLLPAAAEELFGIQYERNGRQSKVKHNGFSRLDLNGDYKVDGNELAKFLSNKSLKGTLSPFEQQMVGYLQVNKDTIAGKGNDITPWNLRTFAGREKERELENRVADRILANPKDFHDRYTTDQYISEEAINKDLDFCNKLAKFPGLNPEQLKEIEARKETGEYLLKHRNEMSQGTGKWFSDNASQDSLTAWAQRIREQNRETVPTVELVGKDSRVGLDKGQAGWMPDLIERYASPQKGSDGGGGHFQDMALSGAGDDKRITKGDLNKYLQVNKDLTPFEKKIVNNMISHYDEIAGASGLHSKSEGISIADLTAYKINQGKIRDEETIANKTLAFLSNPTNYNQFKDSSNGYLMPASVQREISAANASLAGLQAVPENLQTDATRAQIKALQERRDIAEYLNKHIPDMRSYTQISSGVDLNQVREFVKEQNQRHALDEFIDAAGNKSTPAEAAKQAAAAKDAAAKDAPAKDAPAKDGPAKDAPTKEPPPDENGLALRKLLGLPATATNKEVDDKMAADNAADLRKSLGLPPDATDKQVDDKMAADNAAALRKSLGLPPDATQKQVDDRFQEMLSGKWTPPKDGPATGADPAKPKDDPAAKPKDDPAATEPKDNPWPKTPLQLQYEAEEKKQKIIAAATQEWAAGVKDTITESWGSAEQHFRKSRETFAADDPDRHRVGGDLAEAILKNPANAAPPELAKAKHDEAISLLIEAREYYKKNPSDLRKNGVDALLEADEAKAQKIEAKPGYTSDLINQFVQNHWGALSTDGQHVTKDDLANYQAKYGSKLQAQDKAVLEQLKGRYDAIADKDGKGITKASIDAYAKEATRSGPDSEAAKKVSPFMTQENFQALANGSGPVTENQLKDFVAFSERMAKYMGDKAPAALNQQIALAGYLQQHYKELATTNSDGQPVGIDFAKAKAAMDKAAAAPQDYMEANGTLRNGKPTEPSLGQWPTDLGKQPEKKPESQTEKKEPAKDPEKAGEKKESDWDKYIRENVTEKGGFAGTAQYGAAREEAARTGKELVIVVGSRDRPQMLQGVAQKMLDGDNRVYLYLDAEKMKSDTTEFGQYVRDYLPPGSAKAYRVWQNGDSFQWQEQYGLANFGGGTQYNPQPQPYYAQPTYQSYQPYQVQQGGYQQCQPQYQSYVPQRRIFGRWR